MQQAIKKDRNVVTDGLCFPPHPPAVYISQQDVLDKVLLNFNNGKENEEMVPL